MLLAIMQCLSYTITVKYMNYLCGLHVITQIIHIRYVLDNIHKLLGENEKTFLPAKYFPHRKLFVSSVKMLLLCFVYFNKISTKR